jgi:hypothetical protein
VSKKKFNLTNTRETVYLEISSINYCELMPCYKVFVVDRQNEVLHSRDVHERALTQYVEELAKEFNLE